MTTISMHTEHHEAGLPQFRAVAGLYQSVGHTMGEALGALTAAWGDDTQETLVLIQRLRPDPYFTEAQYLRMQELLTRRDRLTGEERAELERLIDAALEATVRRTEHLQKEHSSHGESIRALTGGVPVCQNTRHAAHHLESD